MKLHRFLAGPLDPGRARNDVVDRGKGRHSEKPKDDQIDQCERHETELRDFADLVNGQQYPAYTRDKVADCSELNVAQHNVVAVSSVETDSAARHIPVKPNGNRGQDEQNPRRGSDGDHPTRQRPADQLNRACPARRQEVSPKTESRNIAAIERPVQQFGDEIEKHRQRHAPKPKSEEVVGEPGIDERLQHAPNRPVKQQQIGG